MMFSVNDYVFFQIHGGGGHEDGVATQLNDFLAALTRMASPAADSVFAQLFPGIASLNNLHPLVVHFPIALLMMFFWAELVAVISKSSAWRIFATGLLYSGTIFAALTVFLGLQAASTVPHDEIVHSIMERHETFGFAILALAGFLSVWRWLLGRLANSAFHVVFLVLAALLNGLILLGADLGGLMVYQHGVAVNAVLPSISAYEHEHPVGMAVVPSQDPGHAHEHEHEHEHEHSHAHTPGDHSH